MDMTSIFAPITKREEQEDGSLLVEGVASDTSLDLQKQRCDPAWLSSAIPDWFKIGNIREQHDEKRAAGKAFEHEDAGTGTHFIRTRIYDPTAIIKTRAKVYTGFSIGIANPRISRSPDAPNGVITDGQIVEISLVDRPANPNAVLTMCKTAKPGMQMKSGDFDSERLLVRCEELSGTHVPEMTVTIGDALTHDQVDKFNSILDAKKTVESPAEKTTETENVKAVAPTVKTIEIVANDGGDFMVDAVQAAMPDVVVKKVYRTRVGQFSREATEPEFDRDAAKTLVAATLAKAADADMPPAYDEEAGDIQNAQAAIAIIAKLIVSEASELADNPAEAFDISLLLESLSALRCFIGREQNQQLGDDNADVPMLMFGTGDPDLTKAKYSAEQKRQMMKDGKAIPNAKGDPSFPIADGEDLQNAIDSVGRAGGDHAAVRKHIISAAKRLGMSNKIPDNWTSSGSNTGSKSVGPEVEKAVEVVEKTYTLNEARTELGLPPEDLESGDVVKVASEPNVKTTEPEAEKAATEDPETLVKALTCALEKTDNPLRQLFLEIAEAASAKSVAEAFTDVGARLEKVEAMATPGGPALRRTEIERTEARKNDLATEAARFTALAGNTEDHVLRKGYAAKAAQLAAEIKAL